MKHLDKHELQRKWGMVSEKIAQQAGLSESIAAILGYEGTSHASNAPDTFRKRLMLPADIAHAQTAFDFGVEEGVEIALRALTDPDYIEGQRGLIQEQIEQEKD